MNKAHFRDSLGKLFRLRPLPYRITVWGELLPPADWQWQCTDIRKDFLHLSNISTGHFVDLGFDHIREYLSPDILILKSQMTLQGQSLYLEPLPFYLPSVRLNSIPRPSRRRNPAKHLDRV
jgi:hypothetical protein